MTPKEKAFDLISKFNPCDIWDLPIDKVDWEMIESDFRFSPLEHALLCVDEIIQTNPIRTNSYDWGDSNDTYWQDVRNEIIKLCK